jgi:hypothetical protein
MAREQTSFAGADADWLRDNPDVMSGALSRLVPTYGGSGVSGTPPQAMPQQPTSEPQPPAFAPAGVVTGTPRQQLRQLAQQHVADANALAAGELAQGDIAAGHAESRAGLMDNARDAARAYLESTKGKHSDIDTRKAAAQADVAAARAALDAPQAKEGFGKRVGRAIFGTIADTAGLQAGIDPGVIAHEREMREGKFAAEQQRQRVEQQQAYERAQRGVSDLTNEHALVNEQAKFDLANAHNLSADEIEANAARFESPMARAKAHEDAIEQRSKARDVQEQGAREEQARIDRHAAAAAAARKEQQKWEREAPARAGALAKTSADTEAALAAADKTSAEALKLRGEAAGGDVLPGYKATIPLEKSDVTNIRKNVQTMADLKNDIAALKAIRVRNGDNGTFNADDNVTAQGIMDRMIGKFTQMSGAGAPSAGEREGVIKSLVDPTGHYALTNPLKVYERMEKQLDDSMHNQLHSIGVVRSADPRATVVTDDPQATPATQQQSVPAAQPAAPSRVRMVSPTGEALLVKPELVKDLQAHGYYAPDEAREAPQPQASAAPAEPDPRTMSDQEYAQWVIQRGGY